MHLLCDDAISVSHRAVKEAATRTAMFYVEAEAKRALTRDLLIPMLSAVSIPLALKASSKTVTKVYKSPEATK